MSILLSPSEVVEVASGQLPVAFRRVPVRDLDVREGGARNEGSTGPPHEGPHSVPEGGGRSGVLGSVGGLRMLSSSGWERSLGSGRKGGRSLFQGGW